MEKAVKTSSLLIVCGLMFGTTLLVTASGGDGPQAGPSSQAGASMEAHVAICGGEPCDAVARGFLAFFDRRLEGLGANGRACADCHMPTDSFQLSPASAEARFRLLQLRRRFNPSADDPLFRPIDADDFRINGDQANDFSNLRQNGLVRITFALPPNIRLIDPATNAPSAETFVDVWRSVPTVNDVALTGPDAGIAWPRGPNTTGGYQLDARRTHAPGTGAGRLYRSCAGSDRAASATARRSGLVPARPVHESAGERSCRCAARGYRAVAGSRSAAQSARSSRARWFSSAPAVSATGVQDSRLPRRRRKPLLDRSFDFTLSRASVRGQLTP